MDNLVPCKKGT